MRENKIQLKGQISREKAEAPFFFCSADKTGKESVIVCYVVCVLGRRGQSCLKCCNKTRGYLRRIFDLEVILSVIVQSSFEIV